MKRKIYFLLERLEISRGERITVTILLCCILIISGFYYYHEPDVHVDPIQYENLDRIFKEKSLQLEQDKENILARYQPINDSEEPVESDDFKESSITEDKREIVETEDLVSNMNSQIININSASEELLISLPGIGPAYAKRIVEWREKNGLFTEKEQLLEIRGIGERRLEQLMPVIEL